MIRKVAAVAILASSIGFLILSLSTKDTAGNRDFVAYWAAAQLLRQNENPYAYGETLELERSAGYRRSEPLIMRPAPFFLPLIAPLGLVGAKTGAILWNLMIVGCIVAAVRILRALHGEPPDRIHLIGYLFAPVVWCVFAGQAVALVLTGLVLFLRYRQSRPFAAGLCLAVAVTIKAHLFVPFGIALLFLAAANRHYRVLSGVVAGVATLGLMATLLDPHSWTQYLAMMRAEHLEEQMIPNLSQLFRVAIQRNAVWLQLVPLAVASVWAFWYAGRHRNHWDWMTHGSLLMLVSVMVAPYSWFFDEITLLPAVLHGAYVADQRGRSPIWFGLCAGAALLMVLSGVPINRFYFVWTPVAWLATYVYAVRPETSPVNKTG